MIIPLKSYNLDCWMNFIIGHIGICWMKALARSFIWWPGLDKANKKQQHTANLTKQQ